jgi:hypothetical protein
MTATSVKKFLAMSLCLTRVATMQQRIFMVELHGGGGLGGEREYGLEDADHGKKNRELKGGLTMRK